MVASAPIPEAPLALSDASKSILSHIPSKLDSAGAPSGKAKKGKVDIKRLSPEISAIVGADPKVESYDSVGISIKVARSGLDSNFELNRAYTALMGGDSETAISTYKNILTTEPTNQDALFGLASTYHRLGNIEQARPYYGQLLKQNPNHREGLNNFLALISDESPQEALAELERLEQRNPEFSPIPAQQAVVFSKLGYHAQAREKMLRAIDLAPDNLTYKYNLAVMLDKQGNYVDAGALYRLLIDASLQGQKIPATAQVLQKRLNFIAAAAPTATVGG
jgi:Flp pilus assembly protein TadD